MPKVRLKQPIVEIQGTLYEVVFKRSPQGNIIVTQSPDMSNVEWSPAQKAHRQRFKEAAAYAKAALAAPQVRIKYERKAKKQNKSAWGLAVSDYFKGKDLLTKAEK